MIQIRSSQGVEHFVAEHPHATAGQGIRQLKVKIINPFVVDVHISAVHRPSVWPEQLRPAISAPIDDEADVIHLAVIIAIYYEIGWDLRTYSIHSVCQEVEFPFSPLGVAIVADRIRATVWAVIRPRVGILPGKNSGCWCGIKGRADIQRIIRSFQKVRLQGVSGGAIEHRAISRDVLGKFPLVREPDKDGDIVQRARVWRSAIPDFSEMVLGFLADLANLLRGDIRPREQAHRHRIHFSYYVVCKSQFFICGIFQIDIPALVILFDCISFFVVQPVIVFIPARVQIEPGSIRLR